MVGLADIGLRGGSGNTAICSSVLGSIICSVGPAAPTHAVTMRSFESNVIDAHSPLFCAEDVVVPLPSTPGAWWVSVW